MKKIHSKHYGILLLGVAYSAFIAGIPAAYAQSAGGTQQSAEAGDKSQDKKVPGSVELQPIIISAGVDMDAPYLTPGGVSVIDGNIVQEKYGGDANAIVRSMPGTFTRISSSQPGVAVNIRGFESDGRINTMIDGVPQRF